MSKLGTALKAFIEGKSDAASVAKLVKPGAKSVSGRALLKADAEDPDTEIAPDTFDEVSLAYMKGELSDEQYSAVAKALSKNSSGSSSSRS